jgi:HK97 gp10 family phage protein
MSYSDDVARFSVNVRALLVDVVTDASLSIQNSIKFGSALTGSPGQPVDTGLLRKSWLLDRLTPLSAIIGTNVEYAKHVEFGTSRTRAQPFLRPALAQVVGP